MFYVLKDYNMMTSNNRPRKSTKNKVIMKIVENKEYINSIWHVLFLMYYCWATMYSHHTWLHILFLLFVESKIKMFTIIERTRTHFIMLNGKLLYNRDASVCFSDNLQLLKNRHSLLLPWTQLGLPDKGCARVGSQLT